MNVASRISANANVVNAFPVAFSITKIDALLTNTPTAIAIGGPHRKTP
jgi:hypothetical protein